MGDQRSTKYMGGSQGQETEGAPVPDPTRGQADGETCKVQWQVLSGAGEGGEGPPLQKDLASQAEKQCLENYPV